MISSTLRDQIAIEAFLSSALVTVMLSTHPELVELFSLDKGFGTAADRHLGAEGVREGNALAGRE